MAKVTVVNLLSGREGQVFSGVFGTVNNGYFEVDPGLRGIYLLDLLSDPESEKTPGFSEALMDIEVPDEILPAFKATMTNGLIHRWTELYRPVMNGFSGHAVKQEHQRTVRVGDKLIRDMGCNRESAQKVTAELRFSAVPVESDVDYEANGGDDGSDDESSYLVPSQVLASAGDARLVTEGDLNASSLREFARIPAGAEVVSGSALAEFQGVLVRPGDDVALLCQVLAKLPTNMTSPMNLVAPKGFMSPPVFGERPAQVQGETPAVDMGGPSEVNAETPRDPEIPPSSEEIASGLMARLRAPIDPTQARVDAANFLDGAVGDTQGDGGSGMDDDSDFAAPAP